MVRREMPEFLLNYVPLGRPKVTTLRGGTSFWVTAGQAGVRSASSPCRDLPARGRAGRRTAVRAAAARHPRHDRHVLLLRHRPEPLRGRQHRDGRHPASGSSFEGDVGAERTGRSAEPDRPGADGRAAEEGRRARRTPTRRRWRSSTAARDVRVPFTVHWNRQARERDDRDPGHDRAPRRGRVEQVGAARVPRELPGAPARHGAVLPGAGRAASCSSTSRRSTGGPSRR